MLVSSIPAEKNDDIDAEKKPNGDHDNANQRNPLKTWICDTLQLPKYYDLFISEGFDEISLFLELSESDLKELGILKMGHRKKILLGARQMNYKQQPQQQMPMIQQNNADDDAEGAGPVIEGANVYDTLK